MTQQNEPDAGEAPRLPPGNADRGGRVEEQFYAWREHVGGGPITVGTPTPFQAPPLVSTRFTGYLLVAVRVALVLWAAALGIVTRRLRLAESSDGADTVDTMMVIGIVLGLAWLVVGACWSDQRTRNILRLEGHYPTRARAIRAWVFPAAWVALMSFTLLEVEPNPDFDWRPMIIIAGFVITSWIPYQLIRRLFRSLVRVVPDAPILVLFALDLIASGLLWWWFITWLDTDVDTDTSTLGLLTSAAFAVAMALFVAALLVWFIDRAADRGQMMRERTIRTRHDHRVARLQGLDPLDPATRWALYLARQAADRGGAVHIDPVPAVHPEPAVPSKRSKSRGPATPPPAVEVELPAARITSPVEHEPTPSPKPAPPAVDPDRVPIRALRRNTAPAAPQPPDAPKPDTSPPLAVEPPGTSGIRRRLAAARAAPAAGSGDEWPSDEALAASGGPRTITEQLAQRLGAELAAGGVGDFAATARELSEHYPSIAHSDAPDGFDGADASGEIVVRPATSRFLVMESLRYLALLMLLAGAAACAWLFLGVVDIDPDRPDTVEPVERARRVATYALATSHVLMLGWLLAAACYARRLAVRMSLIMLGVLCGASVACLGAALASDDFRFRAASVFALMIATVALIIGLRAFSASQVALGDATSATNVWIGVAAATACLVLLGPLRTPITVTTKSNELIFFAALCGLAMVVEAVLSALSMSGFENTLRASNRPAVAERQSATVDEDSRG